VVDQSRASAPHPFFWAVSTAVVVGAVAAATAGSASPAFALRSNLVHRIEIGLVPGLVLYAIGLVLWRAWQGEALSRVAGPGGTSVSSAGEPVDRQLDTAADNLQAFQTKTDQRLALLEDAVLELDSRTGHDDARK